MIQEQISTSAPKCLDGNAGFGIVAQTSGMAPNIAQAVGMLSGYRHHFPAGNPRNPVAFLHTIRRIGGMNRHILSRVADCGNDYSGRTNRIAHHVIFEEPDLRSYPAGPTALAVQPDFFRMSWTGPPKELPPGKTLTQPEGMPRICTTWQHMYQDPGWAGVLAERAEKGDPVSLLFAPGMNVLPLLDEAFALLEPEVRWRITFSTFFMKSQETASGKINVKCFLVGSEEAAFARMSPNTLLIDLTNPTTETPRGLYVDLARKGPSKSRARSAKPAIPVTKADETEPAPPVVSEPSEDLIYDITGGTLGVPTLPTATEIDIPLPKKKSAARFWIILCASMLVLIVLLLAGTAMVAGVKLREIKGLLTNTAQEPQDRQTEAEQRRNEDEERRREEERKKEDEDRKKETINGQLAERQRQTQEAEEKQRQEEEERKIKEEEERKNKEAEEERKRKVGEDENRERRQVEKMPDAWTGLPQAGDPREIALKDTAFLWSVKDRVTIEYVPFVDLSIAVPTQTGMNSPSGIKVDAADQGRDFRFWRDTGEVDRDDKTVKETIAVIRLEENGLVFAWTEKDRRDIDQALSYYFHRILLARLHVKVELADGTVEKRISLYEPILRDNLRAAQDSAGYFALWSESDREKGYRFFPEDQIALLVDFPEYYNGEKMVALPEVREYREFSSPRSFGTKILHANGSPGHCYLEMKKGSNTQENNGELFVKCGFWCERLEELRQLAGKIEQTKADLEKRRSEIIKSIRDLNKNIRDLKAAIPKPRKNLSEAEINQFQQENASKIVEINNRIKQLETSIKNYEAQRDSLNNEIKKHEEDLAESKGEIREENKIWTQIQVPAFKIFLMKSGSAPPPTEENSLPLFEAKRSHDFDSRVPDTDAGSHLD